MLLPTYFVLMVATNKRVCRKCTGMCSCYALRIDTCAGTTGDYAMRKRLCVQVFIFNAYIAT